MPPSFRSILTCMPISTPKTVDPQPEDDQLSRPKRWKIGTLVYTQMGLVTLFGWLLWGDFAVSLKDRSVPAIVQLLLKKFEASDTLMGVLVGSLPAVIGLLVVPIVGYRSDRHRGRLGRRIPFLLMLTPIAALSMLGLACSPALGQFFHSLLGAKSPGLFPTTLIFFGAFWTTFEFASIVMSGALIGAFINDVVPRPLLGRFYGLFRALSLIAGSVFNYWLLGKAETHSAWMFVGIGLLYGIGFTVMCLKVKEGSYPPPPAAQPGIAGGFFAAAITYLKESFTQSYYWWVFSAITFTWMSFVPINLFNVFFAKSVHMDLGTYGKVWALTYFISLVLAYPLGALADRFHPLRVGGIVLFLYGLATLWGGLCASDAHTYTIALIASGVLSGTWQTTAASLGQRLFPQSRYAQFSSALGIVVGLGNIILPPLIGRLLDQTGHVYRYTYLLGSGLSLIATLLTWVLFLKFKALGGPDNYRAPEPRLAACS